MQYSRSWIGSTADEAKLDEMPIRARNLPFDYSLDKATADEKQH
jgi:hypothetical protein